MIQFENWGNLSQAAMNVMSSLDAALEREKEYSDGLYLSNHNTGVLLSYLMLKGAIDFSKLTDEDYSNIQSLMMGDYEYSCTMEDVTDDSL